MAIFVSHSVKIVNLLSPDGFFQPQITPKFVFGRDSAPEPTGGAYDAPPDLLVRWGGEHPSPFPSNCFSATKYAKRCMNEKTI